MPVCSECVVVGTTPKEKSLNPVFPVSHCARRTPPLLLSHSLSPVVLRSSSSEPPSFVTFDLAVL